MWEKGSRVFSKLLRKQSLLVGGYENRLAVNFVPKKLGMKKVILAVFGLILVVQTSALAISVAQGYQTEDKDLVMGMAASEKTDGISNKALAERTTPDNINNFVGIVTTKEASSFSVTNNLTDIVIAQSGSVSALVTDINGVVKKGDHLVISPIEGVLAKAVDTSTTYLGIASEDMSLTNAVSQNVKDYVGNSKAVKLSIVGIIISGSKDNTADEAKKTVFLSSFVKTLTGKDVNQWRTAVALIIFFVLLITIGSIVYSAVTTAISAMGRNPLAKHSIYQQLTEVALVVGAILLFGGLMIYLVIWV